MLDTGQAYGMQAPRNPGDLPKALVEAGNETLEMFVFGSWLEGKQTRFNLVSFHNGTIHRVLRGWSGHLVEVL